MPITVQELWDSREHQIGEDASIDLRFVVSGTDDEVAAHLELLNVAPVVYAGLVRQSSHLERLAETTWEASVRYGVYEPPQTGDSSFNFDTGGGTQHITQSLGTVGAWAAPGLVPPNFHGAIGVGKDSIDGVDITIPVYHFGETHYFPANLEPTNRRILCRRPPQPRHSRRTALSLPRPRPPRSMRYSCQRSGRRRPRRRFSCWPDRIADCGNSSSRSGDCRSGLPNRRSTRGTNSSSCSIRERC